MTNKETIIDDRYKIIRNIGHGGMANVYLAYDSKLERNIAIKFFRTDRLALPETNRLLQRFEREAKALAKFTHANVVSVFDYGEYNGLPFIVMEYIEGFTLKDGLGIPMPIDVSIKALLPIISALVYSHMNGIIHRDIKPSNIILGERPILVDFGIAQIFEFEDNSLDKKGSGIGTPHYMAPEQWNGEADERSDIYSLGVILYELITGEKPFSGKNPREIHQNQINQTIIKPSELINGISEEFDQIILTALALNIENRYQTMQDFENELLRFIPEYVDSTIFKASLEWKNNENNETIDSYEINKNIQKIWKLILSFSITIIVILISFIYFKTNYFISYNYDEIIIGKNSKIVKTPFQTIFDQLNKTNKKEHVLSEKSFRRQDEAVIIYIPANKTNNAFWIDQNEVTIGQFNIFTEETEYETRSEIIGGSYLPSYNSNNFTAGINWRKPFSEIGLCSGDEFPVVHVTWNDANEYCNWVGGRLPTYSEWLYVAGYPDLNFPWGNQSPIYYLGNFGNNLTTITPVGYYSNGSSPFDVMDMAGNVWEWIDYEKNNQKMIIGGAWNSDIYSYSNIDFPQYQFAKYMSYSIGFRCVMNP